MKIVAPAATNAQGVLGGVQERPGGPSGGSRNRGDANAPFFPSSQCRCTAFSILNSRMQGTGFAGSSHSRIQNRKGRASLHCTEECEAQEEISQGTTMSKHKATILELNDIC